MKVFWRAFVYSTKQPSVLLGWPWVSEGYDTIKLTHWAALVQHAHRPSGGGTRTSLRKVERGHPFPHSDHGLEDATSSASFRRRSSYHSKGCHNHWLGRDGRICTSHLSHQQVILVASAAFLLTLTYYRCLEWLSSSRRCC